MSPRASGNVDPGATPDEFDEQGYAIVRGLFSNAECRKALGSIFLHRGVRRPGWYKEGGLTNPGIFRVARSDRITDLLMPLLGPDIVLWGARLIVRRPRGIHPWHSDAESATASGFASVWIGLTGTRRETSLKLLPGSHKFGTPIQQLSEQHRIARGAITDQVIEEWSAGFPGQQSIVQTMLTNGDALIFDGRLWHGSNNSTLAQIRTSLLLQYARADVPIRIPDEDYVWPWTYEARPRPQCVVVAGRADPDTNIIRSGPVIMRRTGLPRISTLIAPVQTRHAELGTRGFRSFPLLEGASPDLHYMESHYSALAPGASPHRPHSHAQEELLIVIAGEAELTVEQAAGSDRFEKIPVQSGDFVYYPGYWRHTLTCVGDVPVTYLMFKWLTDETRTKNSLQSRFVPGMKDSHRPRVPAQSGMGMKLLLDGATHYLRKLHVHRTVMAPGKGYAAHADAYDVGIVLLSGQVETLGEVVSAPALVYQAAGERHGLTNVGDHEADYLVFEFHGKHGEAFIPLGGKIAKAIRNPRLVVRHLDDKLKRLLGR